MKRDIREIGEHSKRGMTCRKFWRSWRVELLADEEKFSTQTKRLTLASNEYDRAKDNFAGIDEEIFRNQRRNGSKSSRLLSLKEFQERYEGCS